MTEPHRRLNRRDAIRADAAVETGFLGALDGCPGRHGTAFEEGFEGGLGGRATGSAIGPGRDADELAACVGRR
ncbi:hypothetical protein [Halorubrum sp. 2020YC2]|uniref:hypothetical protein n=1 Tax=Halorubrum sp. 2020YC2 TaxID=2836432 RepID=UPI001BE601C4|nr:hypothetical protein [Halorubrum sp. 2020YC2]QWC18205.1 hypothetical protein KI388_08465 [Halorubrum sp. 2020YC2]